MGIWSRGYVYLDPQNSLSFVAIALNYEVNFIVFMGILRAQLEFDTHMSTCVRIFVYFYTNSH